MKALSNGLARPIATLACAALLIMLLGSCGGRASGTYTGGSGGSAPGSGGGTSSGGSAGATCSPSPCGQIRCAQGYVARVKPGECCPTCVPDCTMTACPGVECLPGTVPVLREGECCPVCEPDPNCQYELCGGADCQLGWHRELAAGACCPTCVPDMSCEAGQQAWEGLLQDLTMKLDAFSCSTSEDCTVVTLSSRCKIDCGTAVNVASAPTLTQELNSYDATNCAACPPSDDGCPAVVYETACLDGRCELEI